MTFEVPSAFWLLVLAAPIVALHMVRVRLRKLRVSTLHFWEQVHAQDPERTAWKKIIHHASLLLHLSILILAVTAMSVPTLQGCTPTARTWVILIDNSPSMGVVEPDGQTRLHHARAEAVKLLDAMGRRDRATMMDLSLRRTAVTGHAGELRTWLKGLEISAATLPLNEAIDVARQMAPDTLWVISDGERAPDLHAALARAKARYLPVGSVRDNAGIVSARLDRGWGKRHSTLRIRIKNSGDRPKSMTVQLVFHGNSVTRASVEAQPMAVHDMTFVLDPLRFPGVDIDAGGTWRAVLQPPDAFPMDDAVSFVLPSRRPPPVVLFHGGDRPPEFLERLIGVLGSEGSIDLKRSYTAPMRRTRELQRNMPSEAVLIFSEGIPDDIRISGKMILIHPQKDVGDFTLGPVIRNVERLDSLSSHPLLELVDAGTVRIKEARTLSWRGSGGTGLLWGSPSAPVCAAVSAPGVRAVCFSFSFDPGNSDLVLNPAFPILFRNLMEWLSAPEGAGDKHSGYEITGLLNERETDVAPVPPPPGDRPSPDPVGWFQDYQVDLAAAALILGLLILEFALYHRGVL